MRVGEATGRTCRLTLNISGSDYDVRPNMQSGDRAFRLRKADGTVYDVTETPHGPECSCPDFVFRRESIEGEKRGCKHIKAGLVLGLIS